MLLTEAHPRATIDGCNMFDHQLADIWQMRVLEAQADQLMHIGEHARVGCRVGILGEPHGGGKTLTMVAHVATAPPMGNSPTRLTGTQLFEVHIEREYVDTTLVIVPTMLVGQWHDLIYKYFPNISSLCLKDLDMACVVAILEGEYDMVVLSETSARRLMNCPRIATYCFKRVVVDEANDIALPRFTLPNTNFLWLMTGRPTEIRWAKTPAFRQLLDMPGTNVWEMQTVLSEKSFFLASCPQVAPTMVDVVCKSSPFMSMVAKQGHGELVDLCDAFSVLRKRGMHTVSSAQDLIDAVCAKVRLTSTIFSTEAQMRHAEDCAKERVWSAINSGADCDISMSKIRIRAVSTCCFHSFDLFSIMQAIEQKSECPVCRRGGFTADQLLVLPEEEIRNKVDEMCSALFDTIVRFPRAKVLIYVDSPTSEMLNAFARRAVMIRVARASTACAFEMYDTTRVLLLGRRDVRGLNFGAATHVFMMNRCPAEEDMERLRAAVFRQGKAPVVFVNFLREDQVA
jgi:hypothetical protein